MKFHVVKPIEPVQDRIFLPSSKSISNRLLIINALSGGRAGLKNIAESDDTILMNRAINSSDKIKDISHAGTAMRFLSAYYAISNEEVILTGSERMKQRPIGELVDLLRKLGASIIYNAVEGYPPVTIKGHELKGGHFFIDGSISSQFISALLMISPMIKNGLILDLKGEIVSGAYIRMTLQLMQSCGVSSSWKGNRIEVQEENYLFDEYFIESDWSAASYWYAIASLSETPGIRLPSLFADSIQGDSVLSELYRKIQIETIFLPEEILITRLPGVAPLSFEYDFTQCPDLVQTMAAVLCAKGIKFHFTGTQTLRIKETDRIFALQHELRKLGFILESDMMGSFLKWDGKKCTSEQLPEIDTYHDHRMAMAFAPLALIMEKITIKDPMVVSKSYPKYWEDLRKAGFTVKESL